MADKKTTTQKKAKAKNENEVIEKVETTTQAPSMSEVIEQEVVKAIENVSSEVSDNIAEIKTREQNIIEQVQSNPAAAQDIVEQEIKHVDEMIKKFDEKIKNLTQEVKKNKVFTTTESWNGWGYDI